MQRGNLRPCRRVVLESERIPRGPERAAALADDRLLPLVQLAADDEEGVESRRDGRRAMSALATTEPRAGRGEPGSGLPSRPVPPAPLAGQADRAGDAVIVRLRGQRAENGELVGERSELREEFAEANARDSSWGWCRTARGNRAARSAWGRTCRAGSARPTATAG